MHNQGEHLLMSGITYYELKRGLLYAKANRKIADLNKLGQLVQIVLPNLEILETASEIHADLTGRGTPIGDADILIAATAITRNLILVSHDFDMQRVPGITLEDWLATEN